MAWNFGSSILGNAEATAKDVEREADVIFTAAFIGWSGPPAGWELLPEDLNKGAGGNFLYLVVTRR